MGSIFHILRKDVRRLAVPIAALILIEALADFFEIQPRLSPIPGSEPLFAGPNLTLLHFAWILLISAVVLQERLPGTRQYWLTRPIGWPTLLAAKLLFVAIFINGIWFLSDCVILTALNLPIHPLDLLLRQIPLTTLIFLPAFCLAAITSGLGQIALSLILAALTFLLELVLPELFRAHEAASYTVKFSTVPPIWLPAAVATITVFLVVFQFARRATLLARLIFFLPLLLIPYTLLSLVGTGFLSRPVRFSIGEPDNRFASVQVAFDFESKRYPTKTNDSFSGLQLPIRIQGVAPDTYELSSNLGIRGTPNAFVGVLFRDQQHSAWIRYPLTAEQLSKVPHELVDLSQSVNLSIVKIKRERTVLAVNSAIFSPGPGVSCRSGQINQLQFLCWQGPREEQSDRYGAFVDIDQVPIELIRSGNPVLPGEGFRWTFSPIGGWDLSTAAGATLPALKLDKQAHFLTLSYLGAVNRQFKASRIDLNQYLLKP